MTKEILTDDIIRQDILVHEVKKANTNDKKTLVWIGPITAAALVAGYLVSWVLGVLIALLAIIPVVMYFKQEKEDVQILEQVTHGGEFTVCTDVLSHIGQETVYEPHVHTNIGSSYKTHYTKTVKVYFFHNAKWRVPETDTLYAWSKEMYISPQGLDNTSLRGDEFYLVTRLGEAEVAYAYNKKFFEYKGNHTVS